MGNARICENGHVMSIDVALSSTQSLFCKECGKSTITHCTHCNKGIWGSPEPIPGVFYLPKKENYKRPSFCDGCGNPYPWTEAKLNAAKELISIMDELNQDEQAKFIVNLPDIISDTPRTTVASTIIKKLLTKASSIGQEGFKQLFFDITIEGAKRMIWPT